MQTVRLDISNDIFDNVMFLLRNLPQNKVKLSFEDNDKNKQYPSHFNPKEFYDVGNSTKEKIDSYLKNSKNEWDVLLHER